MSELIPGPFAIKILRKKSVIAGVKLSEAFELAGLHPSNVTHWSKGKHKALIKNVEEVEVAIQLLQKLF